MKFIDLHCDTLLRLVTDNKSGTLGKNTHSVDFGGLKNAGAMAQFFALYLPHIDEIKESHQDEEAFINHMFDIFQRDIAAYSPHAAFAGNYDDVIENDKNGKISAFLTFEDGRAVDSSLDRLKMFYDRGIRLITLTWNYANCFGAPHSTDPLAMEIGLTDFGKEAVAYMNDLGVIVDVSHLSDGGFWDVVQISKKPFVASHSNARSLSPHTRNLTDDMIRAIAKAGGTIGINFAPAFLTSDLTFTKSTVSAMIQHLHHLKNIGGIDCLCLGSDLDGITGDLEIAHITQMPMLFDELKTVGFSEYDIEKIAFKNALRIIKEVL